MMYGVTTTDGGGAVNMSMTEISRRARELRERFKEAAESRSQELSNQDGTVRDGYLDGLRDIAELVEALSSETANVTDARAAYTYRDGR